MSEYSTVDSSSVFRYHCLILACFFTQMREFPAMLLGPARLLDVFPAAFFGFLKLSRLILFFLAGLGSDGLSLPLHRMGVCPHCELKVFEIEKMGIGIIGFHSWLLADKLRDLRSAFSLLPLC
ncbi:hypothetical protein Peur_003260 [Populus x canadensis]